MAEDFGCEPEFEPITAGDSGAEDHENDEANLEKSTAKSAKTRASSHGGTVPAAKKMKLAEPLDDGETEHIDDIMSVVKPKKKKTPKKSLKEKRRELSGQDVVEHVAPKSEVANTADKTEEPTVSSKLKLKKSKKQTKNKIMITERTDGDLVSPPTPRQKETSSDAAACIEHVETTEETVPSKPKNRDRRGERLKRKSAKEGVTPNDALSEVALNDAVKTEKKPTKKPKGKPMDFEERVRLRAEYKDLDEKYKPVLETMVGVDSEHDVRQLLKERISANIITEDEIPVVLQRWRQMRRKQVYSSRVDSLVQSEAPLEELKATVNELIRKQKLSAKDGGMIIHKWKTRENRRLRRQMQKASLKACYHCREPGHALADCPTKDAPSSKAGDSGICFKCGSEAHTIKECPKKNVRGFPFATCFICGEQGHITRDCAQNKYGIYPDSGACNECGSKMHRVRECPTILALMKKDEQKVVQAHTMDSMARADDDPVDDVQEPIEEQKPKKKVIKF